MTFTDSQTPSREDFVRWGTAPEDRQCRYTFASGYHCHRWSVRGHEYCQEHGRWMECRVDGPIEVPLMEDPQAVELVASQTVRAMGWGHIPPANGRAILHGCRVVQTGFAQDLAVAKFRLKCHTLGLDASQFLPARKTGPEHRAGNPSESVILSGARSALSKDLHFTADAPQNRAPQVSPSLGDVGQRDSALEGSAAEEPIPHDQPAQTSETAPDPGAAPSLIARSAIAVEAPAFRPGSPDQSANNAALAPDNSASSEESTDALYQGTTSSRAVKPNKEIRASAPEGSLSQAGEEDDPATKPAPAPYPLAPTPSSHPLDDLPPAPRPKSVCEPCVDALKAGADESLVDCEHCPAHRSGNLRAPQLPDPRNPPEPAYDSRTAPSPETPPFRDLKNNWDRDLRRAANQRLRSNDRRPGQTYEEILASRARPWDDYLRALPTSPPPPIPNPDAH